MSLGHPLLFTLGSLSSCCASELDLSLKYGDVGVLPFLSMALWCSLAEPSWDTETDNEGDVGCVLEPALPNDDEL